MSRQALEDIRTLIDEALRAREGPAGLPNRAVSQEVRSRLAGLDVVRDLPGVPAHKFLEWRELLGDWLARTTPSADEGEQLLRLIRNDVLGVVLADAGPPSRAEGVVTIRGTPVKRKDGRRSWLAGDVLGVGGQADVFTAREETGGGDSLKTLVSAVRDAARTVVDAGHDPGPRLALALREVFGATLHPGWVLKLYKRRDDTGPQSILERSHAEVNALGKLSHPHVIRLEDSGVLQDDRPFAIFPRFRRGSLVAVQAEYVGRPVACLSALAEVLSGIAAMHAASLVHRDLKPDNVLVADSRELVVADLGLVFDREREESVTRVGERVGNWQFGPDWGYTEEAHQRDPRVDLYSAAKLLWWLASGKALLPREKWNDKAFNLALQFPHEPGMRLVNRVLGHGLAGSPDEMYYKSASGMLDDVRSAIEELRTRRHPARRRPEDCRACQTGHYRLDSTGGWTHLERWRVDSTQAAEKGTGHVVGIQMYRCDACGHLAWYAEHNPPNK